jgi:hypothetical protein
MISAHGRLGSVPGFGSDDVALLNQVLQAHTVLVGEATIPSEAVCILVLAADDNSKSASPEHMGAWILLSQLKDGTIGGGTRVRRNKGVQCSRV